jgi:sugar phosphate isomerase/epimerase
MIGLQLYTLKALLSTPGSRPGVLERVAALGVESVEPYGFGDPADARALREETAAAGLAISSVHGAIPADPSPFFAALAETGVPVAVLPVPEALAGFTRDALASADGVARFAEALSRLAEVAEAEAGARVGYHNHWWEWAELPGGGTGYDALWEQADPRVVAEVDLYWAQAAGQSPAAVVSALGERVQLVHVKDGPGTMDGAPNVALGTGSIALEDALAAGPATLAAHVIEADAVDGDPLAYIAAGVDWLRERRAA